MCTFYTKVLNLYIFKAINHFIYVFCLWVMLKKIFTQRLFFKMPPYFLFFLLIFYMHTFKHSNLKSEI